jgi:hypothetical protein
VSYSELFSLKMTPRTLLWLGATGATLPKKNNLGEMNLVLGKSRIWLSQNVTEHFTVVAAKFRDAKDRHCVETKDSSFARAPTKAAESAGFGDLAVAK